jgi:hypothetical protein
MADSKTNWVWADFNGLFGEILCFSHRDFSKTADDRVVELSAGMHLTAFMEDLDEYGNRDDLIASGAVEPAPDWPCCRGSRWALRIDERGVRHESDDNLGS